MIHNICRAVIFFNVILQTSSLSLPVNQEDVFFKLSNDAPIPVEESEFHGFLRQISGHQVKTEGRREGMPIFYSSPKLNQASKIWHKVPARNEYRYKFSI